MQEVRTLRAQLKPLAVLEAKNAKRKAIAKTATDLEAKAAAIEGEEGARYLSTPEGRTLVRLNGGLNTLVNGLDTADAAPTTQQSAMFIELDKALEEQLAAWDRTQVKGHSATERATQESWITGARFTKTGPGHRRCAPDNNARPGQERRMIRVRVARAPSPAKAGTEIAPSVCSDRSHPHADLRMYRGMYRAD